MTKLFASSRARLGGITYQTYDLQSGRCIVIAPAATAFFVRATMRMCAMVVVVMPHFAERRLLPLQPKNQLQTTKSSQFQSYETRNFHPRPWSLVCLRRFWGVSVRRPLGSVCGTRKRRPNFGGTKTRKVELEAGADRWGVMASKL